MFNFNDFIVENLVKGFENGSFTEEQINIFAVNYLTRGILTKENFDLILSLVAIVKEEKLSENAVVEPPTIEEEATEEAEEVTQENSQEEVLEEDDSDEEPKEVYYG